METETHEYVHVTDNLRFACALTAAGFAIKNANYVMDHIRNRHSAICELDHKHNGVDANELRKLLVSHKEREQQVNDIIEVRGITAHEQVFMAFDSALAGLTNRAAILLCCERKGKLIAQDIGNGRSIIYREGTPKEEIKKLINE